MHYLIKIGALKKVQICQMNLIKSEALLRLILNLDFDVFDYKKQKSSL